MSVTGIQELPKLWQNQLFETLQAEWYAELMSFVKQEYSRETIYPPKEQIFEAFVHTPFSDVKVIIIGQDPYHGPGQAHGLCFSVPFGQKQPPSLRNILKELKNDIDCQTVSHGSLNSWAKQGVLLINAILTVRAKQAASHQHKGWEEFTDDVIQKISDNKKNCVFILWGNYAQKKEALIDSSKHLIIKEVHPSPLSAHRGFFGSKPFSKTNDYLKLKGIDAIDWELPENPSFVVQASLF